MVSRSSAESEYHVMTNVTYELVWIRDMFTRLDLAPEYLMRLYCINQTVVHIAKNLVFYKHTKHIKVDCHLVCQKIEEKIVQPRHASSNHQLADLLTKSLGKT